MEKIRWLSIIRCVGILLVLTYHFFKDILPGGFIGVDVFLTLSGFLITAQFVEKYREGMGFGYFDFMKRRFLRIFPSLFMMIVFTLPLALLISPDFTASISKQATAALGFVTNYYEIINGGSYEAQMLPHMFVHTWFLAVEMHICVFWGLVLAIIAWLRKKLQISGSGERLFFRSVSSSLTTYRSLTHVSKLTHFVAPPPPKKSLDFSGTPINHGWRSVASWRMNAVLSDRSAKRSLSRLSANNKRKKHQKNGRTIIIVISAIFAVMSYAHMQLLYNSNPLNPSAAYFGSTSRAFPFFIGAITGALTGIKTSSELKSKLSARHIQLIIIIASAGIVCGLVAISFIVDYVGMASYRWGMLAASLLCAALIRLLQLAHAFAPESMKEPMPISLIGEMSYGVYLFHWPLYIVFANLPLNISNAMAAAAAFLCSILMTKIVTAWIQPVLMSRKKLPTKAAPGLIMLGLMVLCGFTINRAPTISSLELNMYVAYLQQDAGMMYEQGFARESADILQSEIRSQNENQAVQQEPLANAPASAQASDIGVTSETAAMDFTQPAHDEHAESNQPPPTVDGEATQAQSDALAGGDEQSMASATEDALASADNGELTVETENEPYIIASTEPVETTITQQDEIKESAQPAQPASSEPSHEPTHESTESTQLPASPQPPEQPTYEPHAEEQAAVPSGIVVIGDSVLLGARAALMEALPGSHVNAEGSRQMWQGYEYIMQLQEAGTLPEYVVIALGTNGNENSFGYIDSIIADINPGHRLIFVAPYNGQGGERSVTYRTAVYIRSLPGIYDFVTVADWSALIMENPQAIGADKIHIGGVAAGIELFVNCVIDALYVAGARQAK